MKTKKEMLQGVKQLKKIHVSQLENKNQFLIIGDNFKVFQSYDSLIAIYNVDDGSIILGCDWDYSNTTKKHLYIFMDDYCCLKDIDYLYSKKNKSAYIKKLIKDGVIKYDPEMK